MNFQTLNKQRKFILIAAAVGFISIFLPWVSISFGGFTAGSINGFHDVGMLAFLGFVGAGVVAFLGDQTQTLERSRWFIALASGAIALLFTLIFWLRVGSLAGFGLWISLLAAAGVVGSAWIYKNPEDDIKSGFDSLKKNIEDKNKQQPPPPSSPQP